MVIIYVLFSGIKAQSFTVGSPFGWHGVLIVACKFDTVLATFLYWVATLRKFASVALFAYPSSLVETLFSYVASGLGRFIFFNTILAN